MHDEKYVHRELHGTLFKNTRKKREEEPDYTGTAKIFGRDMKVAGWIKEAKNSGNKFMQLAFTEVPKADNKANSDDDIPF